VVRTSGFPTMQHSDLQCNIHFSCSSSSGTVTTESEKCRSGAYFRCSHNATPVFQTWNIQFTCSTLSGTVTMVSALLCALSVLCVQSCKKVDKITQVIHLYEQRVRSMQVVPLFSHGRHLLRSDGAPNRSFFHGLFNDHAMAIEFLKDIGFIRRTI
jgi:hypothetical protein